MNKKFILAFLVAIGAFFAGMFLSTGSLTPTCVFCSRTAENVALPVSVVSIRDTSGKLYHITGEYPQFGNAKSEFNESIKSFVDNRIADFKKNSADNWQARRDTTPKGDPNPEFPSSPFYLVITWKPDQLNSNYISFVLHTDSFEGGASSRQDLKTFSYDVQNKKSMILADLFPNTTDYLKKISEYSRKSLAAQLDDSTGGHAPITMIAEGTTPTIENFSNFTFNDDVITLYFQRYQVAPGAAGEQMVVISRKETL